MPPIIFNVGLFLGRRYWGDVKWLFCISVCFIPILGLFYILLVALPSLLSTPHILHAFY